MEYTGDIRANVLRGIGKNPKPSGDDAWFDKPASNDDAPNAMTSALTDAIRAGKKKSNAGAAGDAGDAGDSDNESTFSSVDLPPEPIKLENLAIREDPFMQCLSAACGFCALSLESCFHTLPPWDCNSYETYRRFLTPSPTAAFLRTSVWIQDFTRRSPNKTTLSRCITNPAMSPAIAILVGTLMRKSLMDNPLKNAYSKVTSATMDRDYRRAIEDLKVRLQQNSSSTSGGGSYLNVYHDFSDKRARFQAGV